MRFDSIRAPRSLRRTPTERFRDAVYAQRSRTSPADREVRLPFTMPVYGGGSPPHGMFRIRTGDDDDRPA